MRASPFLFLFTALTQPLHAAVQLWQNECVGYFQLQLPASVTPDVFPAGNFSDPPLLDAVYGGYRAGIVSTQAMPANLQWYLSKTRTHKAAEISHLRNDEQCISRMSNRPPEAGSVFRQQHDYLIEEYPQAFSLYEPNSHTVYIQRGKHWYHFWSAFKSGPSRSADDQRRSNASRVQVLNAQFKPRAQFEIPATAGFCLPFGFIAADANAEPHNVAATWRLKYAPEVTIHFQTLGLPSDATQQAQLTDKEYITRLWARRYQRPTLTKMVMEPQWRPTRMAERYGLSTLIESTFIEDTRGFDYIAWVPGDPQSPGENPGLLLHIMMDSPRGTTENQMTKEALEEMADEIAASVQRR